MTNRVIKFRVWDLKNKEFLLNYSHAHAINNHGKLLVGETEWFETLQAVNINDYIIQLYIGFLDKNNREIYEGDIVKCQRVEYGQETTVIKEVTLSVKSNIHTKVSNGADYWITYEDIEVIGHILESPDLLKNAK